MSFTEPLLEALRGLDQSLRQPQESQVVKGTPVRIRLLARYGNQTPEEMVSGLIYLVGLIVVIMFILSFLGLR